MLATNLTEPRSGHTATHLPDGSIAICGGEKVVPLSEPCSIDAAEIFNPATLTASPMERMPLPRQGHAAQMVGGELVLLGGIVSAGGCIQVVEPTAIWNPRTGHWRAGPSLPDALGVTATPIDGDRVLVSGGYLVGDSPEATARTQLWMGASQAFSPTSSMLQSRYLHASVRLNDGRVLVAGGLAAKPGGGGLMALSSAELFDPVTGEWHSTGPMLEARAEHSLTLLHDGSVLAMGGYGDREALIASIERWNPRSGRWASAGATLEPCCMHTATLLPDGKVMVVGGLGGWGSLVGFGALAEPALRRVEVHDPRRETSGVHGELTTGRCGHSAFLLPGSLLVIGGRTHRPALNTVERVAI